MKVVPDWREMTKVLKFTLVTAFVIFFLGFILIFFNSPLFYVI